MPLELVDKRLEHVSTAGVIIGSRGGFGVLKSLVGEFQVSGRPSWAASSLLISCLGLALAPTGCHREPPPPPLKDQGEAQSGFPLTLTDTKGRTWTFEAPAKRLISLTPSVTESLFAIGAGDVVVGVTDYCDYPPEVKERESIGGFKTPSREKIIALNADAVIASRGVPEDVLEDLVAAGQKVYSVDHGSMGQMLASLSELGKIAGIPAEADAVRKALEARRDAVLSKTRDLPEADRPRLLYVVWGDPLFTAGPKTYAHELIVSAGARNVADDAPTDWPQYSLEAAVEKDPEVLLMTSGPMTGFEVVRENKLNELQRDKRWRNVSAVRNKRLIVLDEDHIGVPGPRLIDGLEELAHALHPKLFADDDEA